MTDRSHLTIGEVLSLLREEFPDVSISKIRFLESQGLVDPERTPSGYRKFYEQDVDRLRWILRQQREHFLPLKVIRGRLTGEADADGGIDLTGEHPTGRVVATATMVEIDTLEIDGTEVPAAETPAAGTPAAGTPVHAGPGRELPADAVRDDGVPAGGSPVGGNGAVGGHQGRPAQPDVYTVAELADEVGCTPQLIRDLQQFGILVAGASVGGTPYFDPEAVVVARIGARFFELGVEPRHLRTWRNAADREASLFEQLVMPLLRQRNPQSRRQAADRLAELTALGGELRAGLITEAVRAIK